MTVECKCPICKGREHYDPPRPPDPMHVGSWRYQFPPLTQEQADAGQHISGVGWMVPVESNIEAGRNAMAEILYGFPYNRLTVGNQAIVNDDLAFVLAAVYGEDDNDD